LLCFAPQKDAASIRAKKFAAKSADFLKMPKQPFHKKMAK